MKYEIRYHINWHKVRELCIRENYYTLGSNSEYERMLLSMCAGEDFEDLEDIAEDIAEHSDLEELRQKYDGEPVDTILAYLLNECTWAEPVPIREEIPELVPDVDELLEALNIRK